MVDAHLLDSWPREGTVDDACIDACFLEDGTILKHARNSATTIRSRPGICAELFLGRVQSFERGDDLFLLSFDESFHAETHRRGGRYAGFALCEGVSVCDGGGFELEGGGELACMWVSFGTELGGSKGTME